MSQNHENFEVTMMATADGELSEDTVTQIEVSLKVLHGFCMGRVTEGRSHCGEESLWGGARKGPENIFFW